MIWFTFIVLICVARHSFLLSHYFHLIFSIIYFLLFIHFFVPFWHLYTFLIQHLSSWSTDGWLLTPLKFTCSCDFSMHYTTREGMDLIIGYLSLVSLHFFHPITLAYVTSRVLRPPWGHEIRHYLWQFSLGRAYVDWLKYRCYYVFSYRKYFWKHLVFSLLLGISMFDGFLSSETIYWWYQIHHFVVHQISILGHIIPLLWDPWSWLGCVAILDLDYQDVWLMLIGGWLTLTDVWLMMSYSLLWTRYPY